MEIVTHAYIANLIWGLFAVFIAMAIAGIVFLFV
jgi:hypothetical protein